MRRFLRTPTAAPAVIACTLAGGIFGVGLAVGSPRAPSQAVVPSALGTGNAAPGQSGAVYGALYTGYPFGGTSDPFKLQVSDSAKTARLVGQFAYSDPGCPDRPSGTAYLTSANAPTALLDATGDFYGTKDNNGVTDTIFVVFDGSTASAEFQETIDCTNDTPDVYKFTMTISKPTPAEIRADLAHIAAEGKLTIKTILKAGEALFKFVAPGSGKLIVNMCLPVAQAATSWGNSASAWMLVATGKRTITKAGAVKIKVKLAAAGRRFLRHTHHKVRLILKDRFRPTGGRTVKGRKTLTLER